MLHILTDLIYVTAATIWDVLPIVVIIFGFQLFILRKPIPNLKRIATGFALVLLGLGFFLEGLEAALFPLGKLMAQQLTDPPLSSSAATPNIARYGGNTIGFTFSPLPSASPRPSPSRRCSRSRLKLTTYPPAVSESGVYASRSPSASLSVSLSESTASSSARRSTGTSLPVTCWF